MRVTDAYAACPVCSPIRASIMTGKYPARLHLTDFIAGGEFPYEKYAQPDWRKYLSLEEITIAEVLKTAGYTTASFGKWHLSIDNKPPKSLPFNPDKQGFDEYFVTYKPASKINPESDAHNVEVITQRSLDFIERHKDESFFLYVTHNTIHALIMDKKKLVEKYKNKPGCGLPQNNPVLKQNGTLDRQAIYRHYPHYHSSSIGPCGAVRAGDYKLIEWFDESICGLGNEFELYNLKEDIGEQNNLAKQMPERVENLKRLLYKWRSEVTAQMLMPNPDYNPQKAKKSEKRK